MLRKIISVAVLASVASTVQANGFKLLPVLKEGYKADFGVALIGGNIDLKDNGVNRIPTSGVEVSLICPLFQVPNHIIRQQVSLTQADEGDVKTMSLEVSPHHMWNVSPKLSVGVGPSLGATKLETAEGDDTVFTYGVGTSARYNITKKIFIGGDARYGWSNDFNINGEESDFENMRVSAKLGFQF